MPPSIAEVEAQALQLTPEERAQLADRLLGSVWSDDLVEAWAAESERRRSEIESGAVAAVPVEDAITRARASIR